MDDGTTYKTVGLLNEGRGLFERDDLDGSDTSYPNLHRLRAGHIVMRKLTAWEGPVAVVPERYDGCHVSPEFPTFALDTTKADPRYVQIICRQPWLWEAMKGRSTGSVQRRKRLSPGEFLQIPIPLPPLAEQATIAKTVAAADAAYAAAGSVASAARAVVLALREDVFAGSATRRTVADVADVQMGRQRSPQHAQGEHLTPYLRAANVKNGSLALSDVLTMNFTPREQETFRLQHGDVLVTEGAGSRAAVGAAAVYSGELPGTVCFQNTLLRFRANEGLVTPEYLAHWCRWNYESGRFATAASGTNILHIGSTRARRLPFPDADVDDQRRTVAVLEAAQKYADAATATAHGFAQLSGNLQRDLLAGPARRGRAA